MKLPGPRERLLNIVWLPRILEKAKLFQNNELEEGYAKMLFHQNGVDGQFLENMEVTSEEITSWSKLKGNELLEKLEQRFENSEEVIERWNHIAENLGKDGFPMCERFPIALSSSYSHIAHLSPKTVFEALEFDEEISK